MTSLGSAAPAQAKPEPVPSAVAHDRPVPVSTAKARTRKPSLVDQRALKERPRRSWPAAGSVDLADGGQGRAGGLPVSISGAGGRRIRVQTLDPSAAGRAQVAGVLVRLSTLDTSGPAEPAHVRLNYSSFKDAFGGDWAARLILRRMPDGAPIPSVNDTVAGTLSADLAVGTDTTVALTAAPAGGSGDFTASPLAATASWDVGEQTGDFTWGYPIRVPPTPGGLTPALSLSYSSGAIDGRVSATNNQPDWVGDGWSLTAGFIERKYRGCTADGGSTGDLCWGPDNATLVFGNGGELVKDDTTKQWHLRNDDGTIVQLLKNTALANGDDDGEYWKVTTLDGTQYFFGQNRLPGWVTGAPETSSVWTVPVYGNNTGEPCHATAFKDSSCPQAWRWNLDYVVDVHGNTMSYFYNRESNFYDQNNAAAGTRYTRGGWLDHINYGTAAASNYATPPAQVSFTTEERCLTAPCNLTGNATTPNTNWPDLPADQYCDSTTCTGKFSPTFFTTKRLASVVTRAGATAVDEWDLRYQYPSPGDGSPAALWLKSILHKGLVGGTATLPAVVFDGVDSPNRVKQHTGWAPLNKFRLTTIHNGSGGQIDINYAQPDCTPDNVGDATNTTVQKSNTKRCFVVWWADPGGQVQADWFHKYVVGQVLQLDRVGGNATEETDYDYAGGGAWHFTDSDELSEPAKRTWSVWRGYASVGVRTGSGTDGPRTMTEYRYLRGMDGDTVVDSQGAAHLDAEGFGGFLLEERTRNGVAGAEVSGTVHDPVRTRTATHAHDGVTVAAYTRHTATDHDRVALDGGAVRRTEVDYSYDGYGNPTEVKDLGDLGTGADDRCTRTSFAIRQGTAAVAGIYTGHPSEITTTTGTACQTTPSDPRTAISQLRTYYDHSSTLGAIPADGTGDATETDTAKAYDSNGAPVFVASTRSTYDSLGRLTDSLDALARKTTTRYTETGGLTTRTTLTNPATFATTTDLDPASGHATRITDPNNKITDLRYDPLGRLTGVWLPGRVRGSDSPNTSYGYQVRDDGPSVVTTGKLAPNGNTITSYVLYDGFLRARQTQTPAEGGNGGRVLADTGYDSRGLVWKQNAPFFNQGAPGGGLVNVDDNQVPEQTVTQFDGAGRPVVAQLQGSGTVKLRTQTAYHGDHVDVTPPAGATATTAYTDARGRTVRLLQYHGATPSGAADTTSYGYTQADQLATVTDPAGNLWRYGYDLLGRRTDTTDPDRGHSSATFDDAGQLLTTTDARGTRLAYTYDALGRKTGEYLGSTTGTRLAGWTYDTVLKGLPGSSTRYVGTTQYVSGVTSYNDHGQPLSSAVAIVKGGLVTRYQYQLTYKPDGSIEQITLPTTPGLPNETVTYSYDALGMPSKLETGQGDGIAPLVPEAAYTELGRPARLRLNNGAGDTFLSWYYDRDTQRLDSTKLELGGNPNPVADTHYGYDQAGNVTAIDDLATGDNQCFRYDQLRRLTAAWTATDRCASAPSTAVLGGPAPYWQSFSYDLTGNRTSRTDHDRSGGPDTVRTATYPGPGAAHPHAVSSVTTVGSGDSQTTGYTYNASGDTTGRGSETLGYDDEDRVSSLTDGTLAESYVYDADGNQLVRTDPTGSTLYLPQGVEVRNSSTGTPQSSIRYYSFGGQIVAVRTPAGVSFLANDPHGTATHAVDAASNRVTTQRTDPFGNSRTGSIPLPGDRGFVGGVSDAATGLARLGARDYDPTLGRFLTVDPIVDPNDPQQLNGYAYADNNPTTFSDPTGLSTGCLDYCTLPPTGPHPDKIIKGTIVRERNSSNYDRNEGVLGPHSRDRRHHMTPATGEIDGGERAAKARREATLRWIEALQRRYAAEREQAAQQAARGHRNHCGWFKIGCDLVGVNDVWNCTERFSWSECGWSAVDVATLGVGGGATHTLGRLAVEDGGRLIARTGESEAAELGERAAAGCHSFDGRTGVVMADGSRKPISQVKVGDVIIATDPTTHLTAPRRVVALHRNRDLDLADVVITEASGATSIVHTTQHHLFWDITGRAWVEAAQLRAGDAVQTLDGTRATVGDVRSFIELHPMYDLTVELTHTYYVVAGDATVLVHNCPSGGEGGTDPRDVHGADRTASRGVDVDYVWQHGELYIQNDGQIVRVLDNGNGSFDVVVRDLSKPSGQPTTVLKDASSNYIQNQLDKGRWT
jgi:RHS repeat-associated protein